VGVFKDCPNFWSISYYFRKGKATNLKFCTHILNVDRNKRPLQISDGLTENAGRENDGPSKLQGMKLQDMKLTDQCAGREIAGRENNGPICRT